MLSSVVKIIDERTFSYMLSSIVRAVDGRIFSFELLDANFGGHAVA
jgi:hypothetical protein